MTSYCKHCGRELGEDMIFCPSCGTRITSSSSDFPVQRTVTKAVAPPPTNCSRCGAPLHISLEDVIITCRYCGNTILVATHEEIKKHSMLENRLQSQQAIEAAKKFMDEGIFRAGIAKKASITDVKLRYVPFWVFSVYAETYYRGKKGLGVSELREMKHAVTDKRESRWGKLGKIAKATIELAVEGYLTKRSKGPQFRTVANSFSSHITWTTLARRTMLSNINYYDVPLKLKIPFDPERISQDAEFFNTELNEDEAKNRTRAEVEMKQRQLVAEEVDSIDECSTTMRVGGGELLHVPVWFIYYQLEEEDYAIAIDGSTGKVLGGGRPIFDVI